MPLFKNREKAKSRSELIAEALIVKIGKSKLDDEATKLYFQGIKDFDDQMKALAVKYGLEL